MDQLKNPYLNHQLTSIALNSVSKWKARVLPSFKDYYDSNHKIPTYLTIGFAYLVALYSNTYQLNDTFICKLPNREIEVKDDISNLTYFFDKSILDFMKDTSIWGMDLTSFEGFYEQVEIYINKIKKGEKLI